MIVERRIYTRRLSVDWARKWSSLSAGYRRERLRVCSCESSESLVAVFYAYIFIFAVHFHAPFFRESIRFGGVAWLQFEARPINYISFKWFVLVWLSFVDCCLRFNCWDLLFFLFSAIFQKPQKSGSKRNRQFKPFEMISCFNWPS